jgi:PAS domain S-box-containing protein
MMSSCDHGEHAGISFLNGGGDIGALMRAKDWSTSLLGPPTSWPQSLRKSVRLMFDTERPMYIWWGAQGSCLYNDACCRSMGPQGHPSSLGRPAQEVWAELWDEVEWRTNRISSRRGSIWLEDHAVPMVRNGRGESTYWTCNYSPIEDEDAPDGVGGVLIICAETTQKVLAEHRLASEMRRQRRLFQCAPEFIAVLHGPNHKFEFVSEAYMRLFGGRDLMSGSIRDAVPETEGRSFLQLLDHVYAQGERMQAQQAIKVQKDGELLDQRYLDFICEPVCDETGTTTGIFMEGFDVTERRQTQAELRELNARLEARVEERTRERDRIWQNCRDLLVMTDRGGTFRAVNPAWTRVLGHAPEEVVGHSYLEFVHLDDAGRTFDAMGAGGNFNNLETRFRHKDGTLRWISWNTSLESDTVCAYGRDITAEKIASDALELSEARLRTIFETSHLFQGLLTPDGIMLDANTMSLASINATREDVIGKLFWETPWFTGTPGMSELVMRSVKTAASGMNLQREVYIDLPVGGWRWFDMILRPVRDAQNNVVAIVPEGLELTTRKMAEEALRQSQKLEAMGQLTGGVAHDFNNLLTPIIGGLDMLQRSGFGGEREGRILEAALQSAERAKTVVQRLLAFARRQPLQPVAVDVSNLVTGMANLVASTSGPQINVSVNVGENVPPAKADPHQIEMAILNLSVNARDAMPQGGTLRISATCETIRGEHRSRLLPGNYVLISVADTGIGMDEATLARAIEPFFSTKGIGKGTGLGLSMVHGLASQLGGALAISSKPALGTTAELWLPVSDDPIQASSAASNEEQRSAAGTALLVDDEELVRSNTAEMLADLGFAVMQAASGEDAVRLIDSGAAVDILITDHLMPGMSGVDLVRAARKRRPELPALIISGFTDSDAIAPDLPRLPKPFRQTELAAVISNLAAA